MSFPYSTTSTPSSSSNGGSSATSTNQPSSTSTASRMALNQRTSAKRSFEEYGLNNDARSSSQPSGSSAPIGHGPLGTSSMADAMGILGLGLDADTATITNILGDNAANNTLNAQNTRFKRRRNSLNGAANGNEISQPTPHLPVGPFINPSDPSTSDRAMPGTGEVHMTWSREPGANQSTSAMSANPPLPSLEPPSTQSDAQAVRSSISSILARSLQSNNLWNEVQSEFAPQDDTRSNRMSWTSTAPPTFDTVTTNTEPGWNFNSSTRNLALEFSMPSNDTTTNSSSSRPFENNYVNNESRSALAAPNTSSRSNIHVTPASFETTSSSLAQIPSPQTDFSFSSSLFTRRNYSPIMISDSDESMGVRTRWPSPGPSQPSIQPTESSSSNNLPWWPQTWGYMEENRVPPPPTHSPPAPPHAAAVQQSNFSMPSHPNALDTSVVGNRSRPDEPYRTRRPSSSAWDFVDASPVTPSEYRGYSYYLPSPTDVSSGGNSSRDLPGASYTGRRTDESPTSFHNGSTQYHPQSASASDSDSTMDLHRLLNRHTGLNSIDHFSDMSMPMPRSNEHPFVPSYIQSHVQQQHQQPSPTQESSNGARRVRFPDDVHHAPPSSRVISPPPPNRRSSAFPFALFDRHTRRNEPETSGYPAPSASASSHARSASDGAQGNTQASSQTNNNNSYSRYSDRSDPWRDSFYPSSVPRRPTEPVLFSRISDSDSREPTPRPPVGVRLRESIIDTSTNPTPLHSNSYFPDDLLPLPSPDRERDRERRDLNTFLNRQPSTTRVTTRAPPVPAPSNNNSFWPRAPFGLAPPGLRSNEGAAPPPPGSTSTSRHGRQLSLGGISNLGPSLSLANRPPTPTPSSPSSASPPSPLHHLPFIGGFRPSVPTPGNADLPPSSNSRRNNRRSQPRLETSFSWLDESPISPHPFLFDDEMLPSTISVPRGRAGRGSRAARQPYRMLSVGRIRAVGDYVLDDDFDDSYEGLLALEQLIGPARKGCSTEVLNQLPSGSLKELLGTEKSLSEEEKCPVCLDEYENDQMCTKLPRCSHIYHKDCILGWLKTASTCPVCRESVEEASRTDPAPTTAARRSSALARAHRFSQGLGISQYLREVSGPSTSGTTAGNTQNTRRAVRRRNTNEGQNSVPPMRDLAVDGSGPSTGSRRERNRRLQLDLLSIDTSLGSSSSSRPVPFHQRHESEDNGLAQSTSRPTASSPTRPAAEGSSTSRFTRGPLARLLAPEIASFSRYG